MQLPKIGFRWDFSIGNVISIVLMAGGAIAAWYALDDKADTALTEVAKIPGLEQRLTALETNQALTTQTVESTRVSWLTFQASVAETFKSIEADRREQSNVNSEVLAQLRVVISRLDQLNRAGVGLNRSRSGTLSSDLHYPYRLNYERALARAFATM